MRFSGSARHGIIPVHGPVRVSALDLEVIRRWLANPAIECGPERVVGVQIAVRGLDFICSWSILTLTTS